MDPREELQALRRMAELEAKASGAPAVAAPMPVQTQPTGPVQQEPSAWDRASAGDIVAGLPATRTLAGMAAPVVGALQVGANIGDWLAEKMGQDPVLGKYIAEKVGEYEESKKRGMAALGDTGADVTGLVGSAMSGGLALKGMAPAATWAGKVGQGVAVGAGAGATTPSSTPGLEQTAIQAGAGATLGGGIPAVAPLIAKGGQAAYHTLVEPITNPGAIKGRAYMDAAGPKAQEIVNALRTNQPAVVNSLPTAGEAATGASRAEFSAMQKSAEKILPSDYLARSDARNTARLNMLGRVSGTEADMTANKAVRATTATQNYGDAMAQGIDAQVADALKPQIKLLLERPSMKEARNVAIRLAREQNIRFSSLGQLEGLDWMKKGLDEQISAAAKAGSSVGKEKLAALMQTKQDLLTAIDQLSPGYKVARETFAAQSKPINQMEVGNYLRGKLTPALDETATQKAASFAGAIRDAPGTIKRSLTGGPRYEKLSDVLTPDQVQVVESVRKDLANTARQEMMAQKGAQAGPNAMDVASQSISGATGGGKIPNPLSRIVTIANAILGRLEGKIDRKLALEIATEMLDPKVVAGVMEKEIAKGAKKAAKSVVINNLRLPATAAGVNTMTKSTQGTE